MVDQASGNPLFDDLRTLTTPFQSVIAQGYIPVNGAWLKPEEMAKILSAPAGVAGWLREHQTSVVITAAALAALALIGGRRR